MRRLLLALWLILALVCCPRHAHAVNSKTELLASTPLTSSGNSNVLPLTTNTTVEVKVLVTAVSGTTPQMDLFAESCQDSSGTNCVPVLADSIAKDTNPPTATNPTVTTNVRDIVDAKTSTTSETFTARYTVFPSSYLRVRWFISGTTPSFTTAIYVNGK